MRSQKNVHAFGNININVRGTTVWAFLLEGIQWTRIGPFSYDGHLQLFQRPPILDPRSLWNSSQVWHEMILIYITLSSLLLDDHPSSTNSVWQKELMRLTTQSSPTTKTLANCGWIMCKRPSQVAIYNIVPEYISIQNQIWLKEKFDGMKSCVLARENAEHKN